MPRVIENQTFLGSPGENGVETAAFFLGPDDRGSIIRNCLIDGKNGRWAIKLSHSFDLTFEDCVIRGGTERALDIVRGGNITFRNCKFERGEFRSTTRTPWSLDKSCDIGIKAGARDITFEDCVANDLFLGDYSIYDSHKGRPITRRITLKNCTNSNSWPTVVRELYADRVVTQNTPVKELHVWPLFTSMYFAWNRKYGDNRVLSDDQFVLGPDDLI